jgi:hypothetical protein
MERWEAALSAGLTAMARRGELAGGVDPAALATQTLAMIQGGLLLTQVRRDPTQVRLALDGAFALICAARTADAPAAARTANPAPGTATGAAPRPALAMPASG